MNNLIFTISLDGYLFIIERNTGNILRVTDLSYQSNFKKKISTNATGFVLNYNNLFISTTNGNLLVVDIKTGKINDILKIDNGKISRGFIHNQNMYLIRDNSIIKIN